MSGWNDMGCRGKMGCWGDMDDWSEMNVWDEMRGLGDKSGLSEISHGVEWVGPPRFFLQGSPPSFILSPGSFRKFGHFDFMLNR